MTSDRSLTDQRLRLVMYTTRSGSDSQMKRNNSLQPMHLAAELFKKRKKLLKEVCKLLVNKKLLEIANFKITENNFRGRRRKYVGKFKDNPSAKYRPRRKSEAVTTSMQGNF